MRIECYEVRKRGVVQSVYLLCAMNTVESMSRVPYFIGLPMVIIYLAL